MKRTRIDTESEKNILTGLITSDKFCKELLHIIRPEFLEIEYSKTIVNWIKDYFNAYNESPGMSIQNIYLSKKESLKPEIASLIQTFLTSLSENYEEKESFNEEYILDQSVNYLKKKGLDFHNEKIRALLDIGEIEQAEQEIASFKEIARATSHWVNPFDSEFVESALLKDEDYLFKMQGTLGLLLGPMKRGWLVALMGPMKRGKTWWLQEIMFSALMYRLRVVFITLEMENSDLACRGYKRMGAFTEEGENIIFPIFDCARNQDNSCIKGERTCRIGIANEEGEIPSYDPDIDYEVCSVCRRIRGDKSFVPAVWYEEHETETLDLKNIKKNIKGFKTMYGKNLLRQKSYPMNTANLKDIERDLDLLEYSEGWIPDVIIIDYADILGPEDKRLIGRDSVNETWKGLKSMAQARKCLLATATQSNRDSIEKKNVKQTNTGEDIRKIAHVDIMPVLNQTPLEKRKGITRIGLVAHRHKLFSEFEQVEVLQQLKAGQPYIDGEFISD